ncbi:MAG: hypothetical protein AB7F43_14890 [Bacteriovoracia bacterium]
MNNFNLSLVKRNVAVLLIILSGFSFSGCAIFEKSNILYFVDNLKNDALKKSNSLIVETEEYTVKLLGPKSYSNVFVFGPLIPLIPTFNGDIVNDGKLNLILVVSPKENSKDLRADFDNMSFVNYPGNKNPCSFFRIQEILSYNRDPHSEDDEFIQRNSGKMTKVYQISCRLPYYSVAVEEGPYLTLKGINIVSTKHSKPIPDITLNYDYDFQFRLEAPMR